MIDIETLKKEIINNGYKQIYTHLRENSNIYTANIDWLHPVFVKHLKDTKLSNLVTAGYKARIYENAAGGETLRVEYEY